MARKSSIHGTGSDQVGLVAPAEIAFSVKTIAVDGKRITPAVYRQFITEKLLDEDTAQLRGTPLGIVQLHEKTCPENPHLHVLWLNEEQAPRVALVVQWQNERIVQRRRGKSRSYRHHLAKLLALRLALDVDAETTEYLLNDKDHQQSEWRITIGDYRLVVDDETDGFHIRPTVVALIKNIGRDRQRVQEYLKAEHLRKAVLEEARSFVDEQRRAGVEFVPPWDYIHTPDQVAQRAFEQRNNNIETSPDPGHPCIHWKARADVLDRVGRDALTDQIAAREGALLVLLAQEDAARCLERIKERVLELAGELKVSSPLTASAPRRIWKLLDGELTLWRELEETWTKTYESLAKLPQLFIMS